jgi:hypothetical protein
MVKKTKRNIRSRKHRGGFSWPWSKKVDVYGNPIAEEETEGFLSYFTGNQTTPETSYLGLENIKMPEISNPFASTENSTVAPMSTDNSTITSTIGGRQKSRRMRKMRKGGSNNLGLSYYATPVYGMKVAQPTYMEHYIGGRRGKKTRKQMRKKCKKNCHKSHCHIR